MPRLFVGLEVPEPIADHLAEFQRGLPGARWINPDDFHLTLRFIGDINSRFAREIEDELSEIEQAPIPVKLTGIDVFGGDRPHTLYARVEPCKALSALQTESEKCLRRLGLPPEPRKFVPHITLARLRSASVLDLADYLGESGYFAAEGFVADRFALFSARDSVGGGPYIVEAAYPLL